MRMNSEKAIEKGMIHIPSGYILICKYFQGKSIQDTTKLTFKPAMPHSEVWKQDPITASHDAQCIYREAENDKRLKMWFIFDRALVLPEFLAEFEYVTKKSSNDTQSSNFNQICSYAISMRNKMASQYIKMDGKQFSEMDSTVITSADLEKCDLSSIIPAMNTFFKVTGISEMKPFNETAALETIDRLNPVIAAREKIVSMDESTIVKSLNITGTADKEYLNLCINSIFEINKLEGFQQLRYLNLAFNNITKIKFITYPLLETLDLSFNQIQKLEGLEEAKVLKRLELRANFLSKIDELSHLEHHSLLEEISLEMNPLASSRKYRSNIIKILPTIKKIDGIYATQKDYASCDKGGEQITMDMIIENSKFVENSKDQPMILIDKFADIKKSTSRSSSPSPNKSPQKKCEDWEETVEMLVLNHRKITKIENLVKIVNLRKLALSDNCITKIEGLDKCTLLEELVLERNKITSIEGISQLTFLKKLNIGQNKITFVPDLGSMDCLNQLSLEDNEIKAIFGIQGLKNLLELYLSNNFITSMDEIKNLRNCQKLIILDISGNKICEEHNFRLNIIYLLHKLKVLDAANIEEKERSLAKDEFSGKLTEELLAARLEGKTHADVIDLDLSSCQLRESDQIFDDSTFKNLVDLNLSANNFTSFKCIGYLPKLKQLTMNANKLETLYVIQQDRERMCGLEGLVNLEHLDVSCNMLKDMQGLEYANLKRLRYFNLSHNEIAKIEFLDNLKSLKDLDLSYNRIKQFESNSFGKCLPIATLKLMTNIIKTLNYIEKLQKLESLQMEGNRITELNEIDHLGDITTLRDVVFLSNPIVKKPLYRQMTIKRLVQLKYLDGKEIMNEEVEKVSTAFSNPGEQKLYPTSKPPSKQSTMLVDSKNEYHLENEKPQSTGISNQSIEFKKQPPRPTSTKESQLEVQSAPIKLIAASNYSYQPKQSSMKASVKKQAGNPFAKAIYK